MACDQQVYEVCVMNGGPWDRNEIRLPALIKRFVSRDDFTPVGWRVVYRRTPLHDDRDRVILVFAGMVRPLR